MSHGIEFYDNIGTLTGLPTRVPKVVEVFTANASTTYNKTIPGFDTREGFVVHLGNLTSASGIVAADTFTYSFSGTTLTIVTNISSGTYVIGYGS